MKFKKSIFSILLLFGYLLWAGQISLKDIPDIPNSILKYSQFLGQEQLKAEYWIFLADGVSFQEKLNKGRIEASAVSDTTRKRLRDTCGRIEIIIKLLRTFTDL